MPLFLRHICIKLPQAPLSVAYICARLSTYFHIGHEISQIFLTFALIYDANC